MSKHAKRGATPPKPQPKQATRPVWLAAALLALAGIALVSALIWLAQRNDLSSAQTSPAQPASGDPTVVNGPRISIDQDRFDYGDVKLGATIETAVLVKNIGDHVLELDPDPVVEVIEGC